MPLYYTPLHTPPPLPIPGQESPRVPFAGCLSLTQPSVARITYILYRLSLLPPHWFSPLYLYTPLPRLRCKRLQLNLTSHHILHPPPRVYVSLYDACVVTSVLRVNQCTCYSIDKALLYRYYPLTKTRLRSRSPPVSHCSTSAVRKNRKSTIWLLCATRAGFKTDATIKASTAQIYTVPARTAPA